MVGHEKQEHMPELKVIGRGMNEMFKSKIGELEETMQSKLEELNANDKVMEGRVAAIEGDLREVKDNVSTMEGDLKEIKDLLAQLVMSGKNGEMKTEE